MILGYVVVDSQRRTLDTHRDSYLLDTLTVVSVRRPFLVGGSLFSVGLVAFSAAFCDLLYLHEVAAVVTSATVLAVAGWEVGQLKLLSRDLRGSELSDAIWGRYGRLNSVRRQITKAMTTDGGARS